MAKIINVPARGPVKHHRPQPVRIGPLMRQALIEEIAALTLAVLTAPEHERDILRRKVDALQDFLGGDR